jgi:putative phosphoesterase
MKYFLLSDIHGSVTRLDRALAIFEREHCDMLLLLGDLLNYGPRNGLPEGLDARGVADRLNKLADKIVAVRGNCDSEVDQMLLHFPILSTYALLVDEGRKILLTHGHVYHKDNLPPGRFDAVVYGHTHLWELSTFDIDGHPAICCNTGSITFPKNGNEPTFGILDNGRFTIRNLDNKILADKTL